MNVRDFKNCLKNIVIALDELTLEYIEVRELSILDIPHVEKQLAVYDVFKEYKIEPTVSWVDEAILYYYTEKIYSDLYS